MNELKPRNLSAELRPQRLSELLGQDALVAELRNDMSKRIPLALLFAGEPGVGKSTIAKILAVAVQCTHGQFGEPCEECMANAPLFNIIERNCADLGKIENMRELMPGLEYYPSFGTYRVIILDEAHGIGSKAQEVLLLPTEDPDSRNIFILCTSNPTNILDTVKRRCKPYLVRGINADETVQLVARVINSDGSSRPAAPLANALIKAGITSPGIIVMATDKYLSGATPEDAIIIKEISSIDTWGLAEACAFGNWPLCQKILGKAQPADGDNIKRILSAHFRKILLKPGNSPERLAFAAAAVHELSANNAATVYEQGFQLSILTASVYKICQLVQRAIAAKNAKLAPLPEGTFKQPSVQ